MSADPEKGHGQHHHYDDDVERPASLASEDTSDTDAGHDVEKVGTARLPHDHIVSATFPGEAAAGPGPRPDDDDDDDDHDDGAARSVRPVSRTSSARSRALTIVPRHRRRGLLARFALVPEVERPYDYRNSTKWGITATISFATVAAPLGSSIFYRESLFTLVVCVPSG